MPPWASSKYPRRERVAPVKAPSSWPKSSLSIRLSGSAPQLTGTKGPDDRGSLEVQGLGQPLLADAGLAEEQERAVRPGHPLGSVHERLDGRAAGHEVPQARPLVESFGPEPLLELVSSPLDERVERLPEGLVGDPVVDHREASRRQQRRAFLRVLGVGDDHDLRLLGKPSHRAHRLDERLGEPTAATPSGGRSPSREAAARPGPSSPERAQRRRRFRRGAAGTGVGPLPVPASGAHGSASVGRLGPTGSGVNARFEMGGGGHDRGDSPGSRQPAQAAGMSRMEPAVPAMKPPTRSAAGIAPCQPDLPGDGCRRSMAPCRRRLKESRRSTVDDPHLTRRTCPRPTGRMARRTTGPSRPVSCWTGRPPSRRSSRRS